MKNCSGKPPSRRQVAPRDRQARARQKAPTSDGSRCLSTRSPHLPCPSQACEMKHATAGVDRQAVLERHESHPGLPIRRPRAQRIASAQPGPTSSIWVQQHQQLAASPLAHRRWRRRRSRCLLRRRSAERAARSRQAPARARPTEALSTTINSSSGRSWSINPGSDRRRSRANHGRRSPSSARRAPSGAAIIEGGRWMSQGQPMSSPSCRPTTRLGRSPG